MRCARCNGLMVRDAFQDLLDETGDLCFYGWRCPMCGEIIDPTILTHRAHTPSAGHRSLPKKMPPVRL